MAKASKGVPLSSLLRAERQSFGRGGLDVASRQIVRPRREGSFCILRGPEDLATLIELRGKGKLPKEARKKLKDFLEGRTKEALTRLKRWILLERGRPRDFPKREVWTVAAALREKNPKQYTWRKLALKLDARAYSIDPRGAMDRIRHGVGAVLKDRRGKSKSA